MYEGSSCFIFSPTFSVVNPVDFGHSWGWEECGITLGGWLHSPMNNSFLCLLSVHIFFLVMYLFRAPVHPSIVLSIFLDISPLPYLYLENIRSQARQTFMSITFGCWESTLFYKELFKKDRSQDLKMRLQSIFWKDTSALWILEWAWCKVSWNYNV